MPIRCGTLHTGPCLSRSRFLSSPPSIRRITAWLHRKCLGPNIAKKKQNSLLLPFQALTRLSALSFSVPPSVFFFLFGRDTLFLSPFVPHHSCRTALLSLHSPPHGSLSPVSQQDRTRQVKRWWARRFLYQANTARPKREGRKHGRRRLRRPISARRIHVLGAKCVACRSGKKARAHTYTPPPTLITLFCAAL